MLFPEPVSFQEADDFLHSRQDTATHLRSREIAMMWDAEARQAAFFSARVTQAAIVSRLHDVCQSVLSGQMSRAQARRLLREYFLGEGADALAAMGFAPARRAQGIAQLASLPRLELIIYQNVKMAQERGHYQQWQKVRQDFPYGIWHVGNCANHRETHLARDGKIYAFDHPIWTQSPPGGEFNCHCYRELISAKDMKERGLSPEPIDSEFEPSSLGFDPSRPLATEPVFGRTTRPEYADQARRQCEEEKPRVQAELEQRQQEQARLEEQARQADAAVEQARQAEAARLEAERKAAEEAARLEKEHVTTERVKKNEEDVSRIEQEPVVLENEGTEPPIEEKKEIITLLGPTVNESKEQLRVRLAKIAKVVRSNIQSIFGDNNCPIVDKWLPEEMKIAPDGRLIAGQHKRKPSASGDTINIAYINNETKYPLLTATHEHIHALLDSGFFPEKAIQMIGKALKFTKTYLNCRGDLIKGVNIENTDYHNEQEHYKQAYQSEMLVRALAWFTMAYSSNHYIRQEFLAIVNNNAKLIRLKAYPNVWNGFNDKSTDIYDAELEELIMKQIVKPSWLVKLLRKIGFADLTVQKDSWVTKIFEECVYKGKTPEEAEEEARKELRLSGKTLEDIKKEYPDAFDIM